MTVFENMHKKTHLAVFNEVCSNTSLYQSVCLFKTPLQGFIIQHFIFLKTGFFRKCLQKVNHVFNFAKRSDHHKQERETDDMAGASNKPSNPYQDTHLYTVPTLFPLSTSYLSTVYHKVTQIQPLSLVDRTQIMVAIDYPYNIKILENN